MFKTIIAALGLILSLSAHANNFEALAFDINQSMLAQTQMEGPFHFAVGDEASYKLNMGGFLNGTMGMKVAAVDADGTVTINQDMSLMGQSQNCVEVLNPNTGEVKSFKCNGQDQKPGDQGDVEVVETKEDTVTVPAGTFTCLYIKAKQKTSNDVVEQWINPKEIPVFGLAKTIAPSQLGKVTIELTSFKRM
jgi:hypothetical protein